MTTIRKYRQHSPRSSRGKAVIEKYKTERKMEESVVRLSITYDSMINLYGGNKMATVLSEPKYFAYSAPPHTGKMRLTLIHVHGEQEPRLIAHERVLDGK